MNATLQYDGAESEKTRLFYRRAFWLYFIALAALVLGTVGQYGIGWDEPIHQTYGKHVVKHYESGLSDDNALKYRDLYLYGAVFESSAVLLDRILPFGEYETRHILAAIIGLLGILGAWKLASTVLGYRMALLAAVILSLLPSYYGHLFFNHKDIPFATGYVWSLYYLARLIETLPRMSPTVALKLGIVIGLTLGIRVGGLLLLAYLGLLVSIASCYALRRSNPGRRWVQVADMILGSLGIGLLAYTLMVLPWPWALQEPWSRPFEALQMITRFHWAGTVLYDGVYQTPADHPQTMILGYLWVKLPLIILALMAAGSIFALVALARLIVAGQINRRHWKVGLIVFSVVFPLAYIVIRHSLVYDGIRHVLFILPPVAVLSALTIDRIFQLIGHSRILVYVFAATAGLYIVMHLVKLVELHPYQYVYYNELTGGLYGAHRKYETDYWALSYREATEFLNEYIQYLPEQREPIKLWVCWSKMSAGYYMSERIRQVKDAEHADFIIAFTRFDCDKKHNDAETILVIHRDDTPLSVVKRVHR